MGVTRVFGYHLRPLEIYSIFNYRTNSIIPIEYSQASEQRNELKLSDVQDFVKDQVLAEKALSKLQNDGGDLLLVQRLADGENSFLDTIKQHSNYSSWFIDETNASDSENEWSQLERTCSIRFTETNEQTSILSYIEAQQVAQSIVDRWKNETDTGSLIIARNIALDLLLNEFLCFLKKLNLSYSISIRIST